MSELLNPNRKDIAAIYENEFVQMAGIEISLDQLVEVRERLIADINAQMTSDERQFLLSVKGRKPEWSLLGMDAPDKVAELPSVKWRLVNLEKLADDKHELAYAKLKAVLYRD